ncbi:Transposase [Neochlamydia sp. TUME1]|nr:Transposase [Neochlamydia sp. TUME1]
MIVDKKSRKIICTAFCNGKRHDFRLFKESKTHIHSTITLLTDTEYQGLQKIHFKTQMSKKRSKKNPLTQEDRKSNQKLSKERVLNENAIRF